MKCTPVCWGTFSLPRTAARLCIWKKTLPEARAFMSSLCGKVFRLRILSLWETAPRGIPFQLSWSPDANQLAVSIATDYDMDIFAFELANNQWRPLTRGGGYDFYPVWSPDGRYIAYLSDVAHCPNWQPSAPEPCDSLEATLPRRGQLYILDLQTSASRRLSEIWFSESPHWLDETTLTFVSGDLLYGETERILWLANIETGTTRRLFTNGGEDMPSPLDVFWRRMAARWFIRARARRTALWSRGGMAYCSGAAASSSSHAMAWWQTGRQMARGWRSVVSKGNAPMALWSSREICSSSHKALYHRCVSPNFRLMVATWRLKA